MLAHFAAIAGLFVTTKWRRGIEHVEGVNPDYAGLDLFCEVVRARNVARPDACRKTINGFVRLLDKIVLILERADWNSRTENLFERNAQCLSPTA